MYLKKKRRRKIAMGILGILILIGFSIYAISNHIRTLEKTNVLGRYTQEKISWDGEKIKNFNADAIIVLGASVREDKKPSPILQARLDTALDLYKKGVAPKVLVSGDNDGKDFYDEITPMLNYLKDGGVPSEDIFCDHKGYNTFASMVRAKQIFGIKHAVVVTQSFHLPRAIYIGQKADMKTRGVASDQIRPREIHKDNILLIFREIMANNKDFWVLKWGKIPQYKDEKFDIEGDGSFTHQRKEGFVLNNLISGFYYG